LAPRFNIVLVLSHPGKVLHSLFQCPERKYISNWIATLICRSEDRICGSGRTFGVSTAGGLDSSGKDDGHTNGIAVKLSKLWKSTSRPALICTAVGQDSVLNVSTTPRLGFNARLAMPVLKDLEVISRIAVPVVSEPVPAVVGTV
jgi:hypothetical protein